MTNKTLKPYCALMALIFIPAAAKADAVLDWNLIMQNTLSTQAPFPQARLAAITQLAVFEAVNAITRDYQPYLGSITAPANASTDAAAATAAHDVLRNYIPNSAAALDAALALSLSAIPNGPAKTSGIAVGQAAAAAMIAARANDGSSPLTFYLPSSSDPGQWQTTPGCPAAGGAFFNWRNVTTFGIRSPSQFRLGPPPALTGGPYARTFNEVKLVGAANSAARPQDRSDVARFYAVTTPVMVFNDAARQISTAQGQSLSQNARALALINMAISDGAVATFDSKYHHKFWRPETAIQNAGLDGSDLTQPDAAWTPYITAPCFPAYPSAHGALSNAAREVMEHTFGGGQVSITLTNPAVSGVTLKYTTLQQIADDIEDARVYGGIHFRTDQDAGSVLGRKIGQYVYLHNLRSASEGCAVAR